jgi:hypothetical protein
MGGIYYDRGAAVTRVMCSDCAEERWGGQGDLAVLRRVLDADGDWCWDRRWGSPVGCCSCGESVEPVAPYQVERLLTHMARFAIPDLNDWDWAV